MKFTEMARKIRFPRHFPLAQITNCFYKHTTQGCGRSSGVERYLAKVNVVSSNLIARSNNPLKFIDIPQYIFQLALLRLPIRLPSFVENPCSLTILCTYG